MRKILLAGQMGEIVRSISEGLSAYSDDFNVQLCSEDIELIKSMEHIVKPELIIYCQIGVEEKDDEFFLWVKESKSHIPVIVITTRDDYLKIAELVDDDQFDVLYRPVSTKVIAGKCYDRLGMKFESGTLSFDSGYENEGYDISKKRILVVDDSAIFLRSAKAMLEAKYEVFFANSGEKALEQIPKKRPHLILLDYEMGGMSGKETYEAILADEFMRDIPVIFLTGISDKSKVYGVLKSIPAGYVLKPVDKEFLLNEIERVLEFV